MNYKLNYDLESVYLKYNGESGGNDVWAIVSASNPNVGLQMWGEKTSDNASRTVLDTDAIQASTLDEAGLIETEDIANFGRVYKVSGLLKMLRFDYTFNATAGVAFQIRYSDTKPSGSSDAKSDGTQCSQGSGNVFTTCIEYDVPANRYFWFALSGGGSRVVNKRDLIVGIFY